MKRLIPILSMFFGFALIGGVGWLLILGARSFLSFISAVPKELAVALITGAATVLVATLTVMVGRYYERKKELDALYRDKKTEIYDAFLKEFFTVFHASGDTQSQSGPEDNLVSFFREFTRKLLLWSGPEVIESFIKWKDHLAKGEPDAKSIFLTEDLLFAIRKDLRHSNKNLRKGFFARLFLKEGGLFLEMAKQNPDVTLSELAIAEEQLKS